MLPAVQQTRYGLEQDKVVKLFDISTLTFERALKIGILTYHYVANFGANLQAYSTLQFLRANGHEAEIINYRSVELDRDYGESGRIPAIQLAAHEQFIAEKLQPGPVLRGDDDLVAYCNERDFDCIVLGSDAVLRFSNKRGSTTRFPNPYWMEWTNRLTRRPRLIGLALSAMGTSFIIQRRNVRKEISKALGKFDALSFRDTYTRVNAILAGIVPSRAVACPDPVFVLNRFYRGGAPAQKHLLGRYAIVSTTWKPPVEWVVNLKDYLNRRGLKLVSLPMPEHEIEGPFDHIVRHPLDPLDWYDWIRNADGILCSRFHPTLCALANGVPVAVMDRYSPRFRAYRSKIFDLLWKFGRTDLSLRGRLRRSVPWDCVARKWESQTGNDYRSKAACMANQYSRFLDCALAQEAPQSKR